MRRVLIKAVLVFILVAQSSRPALAISDNAFAFIAGVLIAAGQLDAEEQARKERELETQNELMRRYIVEKMLEEQRARERQRQLLEAEIERRKVSQPRTRAKQEGASTGSGFFISKLGYVVTNAHVVRGARYVYVRDRNGVFYVATLLAQDDDTDLAILKTSAKQKGLPIGVLSGVTKGQKVFAIGYPVPRLQGSESKITDGIISSFSGLQGDSKVFQISTPIQPGNSGGPLINGKGEVVGVVVSKAAEEKFAEAAGGLPQNVNFAVRTDVLSRFLVSRKIDLPPVKVGIDNLDYADANTVLVVASGIELAIPALSPGELANRSAENEADDWLKAKSEGTCGALDIYIATHKGSKNYSKARKARAIVEQQAWINAQKANTASAYRDYDLNCPGGIRKVEIEKAIVAFEAREIRLAAELDSLNNASKNNTCTDLERYIEANPKGEYLRNAKDYLSRIENTKYQNAQMSNSVAIWDDFLVVCPRSQYASEAKAKRDALRIEIRESEKISSQINDMKLMVDERKFFELEGYANSLIDSGVSNATVYAFAGIAKVNNGDFLGSIASLQKSVAIDPSASPIKVALGHIQLMMGEVKASLTTFNSTQVGNLGPKIKQQLFEGMAIANYRLNDDAAALSAIENLSVVSKEQAENFKKNLRLGAGGSFGALFGASKRIEEDAWWGIYSAMTMFDDNWKKTDEFTKIYLEKYPQTRYGYFARSIAKFMLGDESEAFEYFSIAHARNPAALQGLSKLLLGKKKAEPLRALETMLARTDPKAAFEFHQKFLPGTPSVVAGTKRAGPGTSD